MTGLMPRLKSSIKLLMCRPIFNSDLWHVSTAVGGLRTHERTRGDFVPPLKTVGDDLDAVHDALHVLPGVRPPLLDHEGKTGVRVGKVLDGFLESLGHGKRLVHARSVHD